MEKNRYKNSPDINFANTGNQIQFLDTIKYFQQSLGALADSLTDKKNLPSPKSVKNFLKMTQNYLKDFCRVLRKIKNGKLIICRQEREQYRMKL